MFEWLTGDEVPLGPAMEHMIEDGIQALPDHVQIQAWMGREQRQRAEGQDAIRAHEQELFAPYADADEIAQADVYESQHDQCVARAERKAARACLKGRAAGHTGTALTPEECMESWRDGVAVTGGTDGTSAGSSTTDGSLGSETIEGGATAEVGPVPKVSIGGKGQMMRGRNHSDTTQSGTSTTTTWTQGHGYLATCDAEAQRAEDAVAGAQRVTDAALRDAEAQRANRAILASRSVRDASLGRKP